MKTYDVIVVGSGPAGIFAALELVENNPSLRVLILEKGRDVAHRKCPMKLRDVSCAACPECALLSGWGGAGASPLVSIPEKSGQSSSVAVPPAKPGMNSA